MTKIEVRVLMKMMAEALGEEAPSLRGCSAGEHLTIFRKYTSDSVSGRPAEQLEELRDRIYVRAFNVGRKLGRLPGVRNDARRSRLIRELYRNIGITIEGDMPGDIRIPRCSFSGHYTPEVCHIMSGMDAGIICGIFGGGVLRFSRRLTEGCEACEACYRR